MDDNRSKRLGRILESANQFEAEQIRRSKISTLLWMVLAVLILIGTFFAGRAWYSMPPAVTGTPPAAEPLRQNPPAEPKKAEPDQPGLKTGSISIGKSDQRELENTRSLTPVAPVRTADPSMPAEVELTAPAELHVKREGKIVGVIYLKAGEMVRPLKRDGGKLRVEWGDAEGTVLVSQTTLLKAR